ncbi:hypothetical protein [Halocatena marina]|uniref:Transposase n=1 Tax=Halocatena marina TaxID=2934937 RepID=A0ABD5YS03_9EURY|nr:hypothetical protein [Halocatena marina]
MIRDVRTSKRVHDKVCERLETAATLVEFVRDVNVDRLLTNTDDKRFEARRYDAASLVRAFFCRELAGLSWNGLYEFLSNNARAVRLGFDPSKFGPLEAQRTHR